MEYKVRAVEMLETKSVQEVEKQLLDKHEESLSQENNEADKEVIIDPVPADVDLKDEDVLSYIGKRYNKQINSLDELVAERKEAEPLPEDVAAYMKYKKDTGRGFDDFLKLNKDFDTMSPDQLLKEYLSSTQEGLDSDDIETLMDEYKFDIDLDDDSTVKKAKIAKRKFLLKLRNISLPKRNNIKCPLSQERHLFQMRRKKYTIAISNIPNRQRP